MLASDSIRLLATAGAAVAVWTSAPAVIVYAAALIVTAVSTAFQPAQTALLPSLTSSPEQLTAANVVTSTIESVGTFLGPALGGLMLVWAGTGTVMAIDSLTFAWSLVMLSGIPRGERPIRESQTEGILAEVAEGFAAVGSNPRMRLIMGLFGAQVFVSGAISVLIVVMALQLLDMGQSGVGLLNAAIGVGGVLGSVVAAALVGRGRQSLNFAGGLVLWGVPIALVAVFTNSGFALAMLVVVGVGNVLVDVAGLTLLQRVAPDDVLGRVFGVLETVFSLAVGLGGAAAPLMIDLIGIRGALVATGVLLPVLVGDHVADADPPRRRRAPAGAPGADARRALPGAAGGGHAGTDQRLAGAGGGGRRRGGVQPGRRRRPLLPDRVGRGLGRAGRNGGGPARRGRLLRRDRAGAGHTAHGDGAGDRATWRCWRSTATSSSPR